MTEFTAVSSIASLARLPLSRIRADAATSVIEDIKTALKFIRTIEQATLDNGNLDPEIVERLRHPLTAAVDLTESGLRLSLDIYLAITNASEQTYNDVCAAILRAHPEDELLSFRQIKQRVADISGVTSIVHDMCVKSCLAYTGPFSDLEVCPECAEPRYDPIKRASSGGRLKIPRQQFHTIPLGPQLQALFRSPESAEKMRYRNEFTAKVMEGLDLRREIEVYQDIFQGSDYIAAVDRGDITPDDIVLMMSIDGAQLYRSKQSDCWIYIWIVCDLSPDQRYKKVHILPGGIIPGPHPPKNMDSYTYVGIHHVSALQREGLMVWDASTDRIFKSKPFIIFWTADRPGMVHIDGHVGHNGGQGCRTYCPMKARHKKNLPTYYPAILKPINFNVRGSDHGDINLRDIAVLPPDPERYRANLALVQSSPNITQYKKRRLLTGISKPTIISGLPAHGILPVPTGNPPDIMHLLGLNIPELFVPLWRALFDCDKNDDRRTWDWAVLTGDFWIEHGQAVADITPYLPGSFDRPPRNPAEKISSGYKAWEYLIYFYGMLPALLMGVLPDKYWRHFCKLCAGVRLLLQYHITRMQLQEAHIFLVEFAEEYEELYYQRLPERLHFCRQSIHTLAHLSPEAFRLGPQSCYPQWPLERIIGDLGSEIKQPSHPYANLSQRAVRRAQVNALKAMIPELSPQKNKVPRGAVDLGGGFVLLRARDRHARTLNQLENNIIWDYVRPDDDDEIHRFKLRRWARLRLPNGQVARSAWKEKQKALEEARMARVVKVRCDDSVKFAEVRYYFRGLTPDKTFALVCWFTPPEEEALEGSSKVVWALIPVQDIVSVVCMAPFAGQKHLAYENKRFFLIEKPGTEVAYQSGVEDNMEGE
ncbi:hypothetical protein FA95DRAFT_1585105 [Auriscalpium vulgare]|uniref:Uncharacterized protein n=1 Tax=Auriscalpium vulgare TaxID=40419 RepID=A0ACB8R9C2_9AGAM|nr:hypothetical protein FA95DRAFT_1585105 [Auriscalpium vulgare]